MRRVLNHESAVSLNYLKEWGMRILIAILLPFLVFFTIGRPWSGFFCLLLQLTLIGWLPAALWAVYSLSQYETDKKLGG